MKNLKWDQEIERLKGLKKEGRIDENDMDEVSDNFDETRDEVTQCLMDIDYDDLPKTGVCDKCYKTVPYEEITMGEGTCAECINKESNKNKKLKVIMTRE